MTTENDWAQKLVDAKAWVMHTPSGTIGPVAKLYDKDGEAYFSPINGEPVKACVLELASGHAFVAISGNFLKLSEKEVNFYLNLTKAITTMSQETAKFAFSQGIPMGMALTIYSSALKAQVHALLLRDDDTA